MTSNKCLWQKPRSEPNTKLAPGKIHASNHGVSCAPYQHLPGTHAWSLWALASALTQGEDPTLSPHIP